MDYRILLQLQADVNGVKPADYSQLTLGGISPIALSSYPNVSPSPNRLYLTRRQVDSMFKRANRSTNVTALQKSMIRSHVRSSAPFNGVLHVGLI